MGALPFLVRRPILLVQGVLLDRQEPDLDRLRSIEDPERFGWSILPHVARSFAASVVWLPKAAARTACVGYLYARMLDTCEDMVPDRGQREAGLRWFATRFAAPDLTEPAPTLRLVAMSRQQEVDELLFERHALVDELYLGLPEADRDRVAVMVAAMASSMERWGATFAAQGGVLETDEQLDRYCDDVIGEPARFVSGLMVRSELTELQLKTLSGAAEFIQLANITRDIERDLEGGVAYHPSLQPFLGHPAEDALTPIREVRRNLLMRALWRAPSFTSLLDDLPLPRISAGRGSGVVMLLFTDRYYRSCAIRAGIQPWKGASSTLRILSSALLAVVSRRWTKRVGRLVADRMQAAADLAAVPLHPGS